ncbi:unnamed protein product [Closterium sp. Naga37s-1]|nr:unnamed protein product [Closterium sp. Naga37s-1]
MIVAATAGSRAPVGTARSRVTLGRSAGSGPSGGLLDGECAIAAETIKELKVTVEILVQQLQQVNIRLAAAEKRNVFVADEKNGADVKGSIVEAAAEDEEKAVPKSDTREEQKHKAMVQLKGAAKKEKSLVLNVGGYAADEAKEIGEPKVMLSLKEAEIVGEQTSAFLKSGVGISYAAALLKGERKELFKKGEQLGKGANPPMRMTEAVKRVVKSTDVGGGLE